MIRHLNTAILRIRLAMVESDLHWIETTGRQQRREHRARIARLRRALGHNTTAPANSTDIAAHIAHRLKQELLA